VKQKTPIFNRFIRLSLATICLIIAVRRWNSFHWNVATKF
jgi:hypothetical protein